MIFYQISGILYFERSEKYSPTVYTKHMAYRYRSRRSTKKLAKASKRNFLITLILIALLSYITINWLLPYFVNGIGFVRSNLTHQQKAVTETAHSTLAPPVLNIPFEATNTAQINIKGYGTSNSKVALFLDDAKIDTQEVSSDGSFEIKNVQLVLGTNNIFGKSIDENDKESLPSKLIKIIYDNEKPILNISEPEDGKTIQGDDKKVKISGNTEAGARVFITQSVTGSEATINDSQIIVDKDGKFSSEQTVNEGENNFNIKALDQASNLTEISRKVIYQP